MIDHIGLAVKNMDRAKAFYMGALNPLGVDVIMEVTAEQTGADAHAGFGKDRKAFFWIGTGNKPRGGAHVSVHRTNAGRSRFVLPSRFGLRRPGQWRAGPKAPLS